MITLALDCSTQTIGLSILEEEKSLADVYLRPAQNHSSVLLPAMENLLKWIGIPIEEVDLFACTVGPGSFTGIRIGVSTMKGLALATGKPLEGVSTLEALAVNGSSATGLISPLLDAGREQVYAGLYRMRSCCVPENIIPDCMADIGEWLQCLPSEEVDLIGDGAVRYRGSILEYRNLQGTSDEDSIHRVQAKAVGRIAIYRYGLGIIDEPLTLSPKYCRAFKLEQSK